MNKITISQVNRKQYFWKTLHCIGFEALTVTHWNCCNHEILKRLAPHCMAIRIDDLRYIELY